MGDQNENVSKNEEGNSFFSGFPKHVPTPQERAEELGYTAETHEVTTKDGYILQMHRITGSNASPKADNKPVVFLLHGLLDCSITWIILKEKSLALMLADRGYDVWMGNVRGNRFSRNHKWMSTAMEKYWLFSWHEMGMFDLPAMIDYVLEETKQEKLIYVGHSQGCTTFFVMASMRPEYQQKIEAMFALAPAIFMKHATLPLLRILAPFADEIKNIGDLIGMHEFRATPDFLLELSKSISKRNAITQILCGTAINIFAAPGETLMDQSVMPEVMLYDPAGASTRQFVHYAQLHNSGRFCQFDYGILGNWMRYHWYSPPDYPLENIKIPVYLHYSSNDAFVNVEDLKTLYERLPNRERFLVPELTFTHLDFVWGAPADILVCDKVLNLMLKHAQKDVSRNC